MKGCDIYLTLKIVYHKSYRDLYSLSMLFYCLKDLSIDFLTSLSLSVSWKSDNYDSFLVIVDCLTKMFYYKSVKTTIDVAELAKVIISIVVGQHNLSGLIISNQSSLFIPKLWFLLYYFLGIKLKLFTVFYT